MTPKLRSRRLSCKAAARSRPKKGGDPLRQQGAANALRPLLEGGGLVLSVPVPRRPRHIPGRWEVIGSALESWGRTVRLCPILLVTAIPPVAAAVVALLIHHVL